MLSSEATSKTHAFHGPGRSGQAAEVYATGWSNPALELAVVQSCCDGEKEGRQSPFLR